MPALSEADVASAVAGAQTGLRRVYEELAPAITVYLRARGSDDPEGVTQDVFVALLPRLDRLHGGLRGLRTLAFSVAHAGLVDETRRRLKRPAMWALEPNDDPPLAASAEEAAISQVEGEALLKLLGHLREDQRTVVALRVIADLTLEETAEVVGKSIGAVKQLQRRGLLALRELVNEREGVTR